MPPPIPIPRPAWPPSTIKMRTTRGMVEATGWSEGEFQRFKEHVMGLASRLKLDTLAGPQMQDAHKWALLVDECVKAFPALNDFAGRWPVEFYYTQYTYWRGMNERRKQKGERGAGAPRMDSIAAPTDESRGGQKKRKEHPDPGRGEKENVSVGDSERRTNPNPTQTAAASQNSIITGTTPAPASSLPVASSRTETSSMARHEDTDSSSRMTCNTFAPASSPLVPRGRIEGSSTARREDSFPSIRTTFSASALTQPQLKHPGIRSDASSGFNMSAPAPPPSQPRDRRNVPMARREDSFTSSQVTTKTSAPASSPLFPARGIEGPSKARREDSFTSSQITESSTPASSPPLLAGTSSLPRTRPVTPQVIFTTCVFCGFQPPIPSEQTTEIELFFNARDDLRQVFTAIGVVADHHLHALLSLGAKKREALLRSLTPDYLTYVEKIEIADMLETQIDKTSSRPAKSKHTCKHAHVKKQMRIADDEEYFEIVGLIEAEIPRYLDLAKAFDEQDDAQIGALIKSICEDRPSMRKYPDSWPIFVHMKRFFNAQEAGLAGKSRESQHSAPSRHECPRNRKYPAEGVPPSVVALLADYGMEELGPAVLFLGIKTDAQFTNIFTSERAKSQLLADLPPLGLSVFQASMMRFILERARARGQNELERARCRLGVPWRITDDERSARRDPAACMIPTIAIPTTGTSGGACLLSLDPAHAHRALVTAHTPSADSIPTRAPHTGLSLAGPSVPRHKSRAVHSSSTLRAISTNDRPPPSLSTAQSRPARSSRGAAATYAGVSNCGDLRHVRRRGAFNDATRAALYPAPEGNVWSPESPLSPDGPTLLDGVSEPPIDHLDVFGFNATNSYIVAGLIEVERLNAALVKTLVLFPLYAARVSCAENGPSRGEGLLVSVVVSEETELVPIEAIENRSHQIPQAVTCIGITRRHPIGSDYVVSHFIRALSEFYAGMHFDGPTHLAVKIYYPTGATHPQMDPAHPPNVRVDFWVSATQVQQLHAAIHALGAAHADFLTPQDCIVALVAVATNAADPDGSAPPSPTIDTFLDVRGAAGVPAALAFSELTFVSTDRIAVRGGGGDDYYAYAATVRKNIVRARTPRFLAALAELQAVRAAQATHRGEIMDSASPPGHMLCNSTLRLDARMRSEIDFGFGFIPAKGRTRSYVGTEPFLLHLKLARPNPVPGADGASWFIAEINDRMHALGVEGAVEWIN
ncbi:hypothetical protein DFH09DRAFT_1362098 [Mycena vulgaris]|nr:hypothetical protein DFH09DRAFT_1362098 [Mycena vulgaris]